ncbi:hypothetical protein A1353_09125 [Methylomonas methanica]|uniref:Type I restriction modification DNA specificity domain-containing protein n=1 Tax=Methylomonas methanica TaxID=421 RepID=A0A177MKP6_METMH|nr:restriction endonuclease subunit S [Methylomonas methanica]OAI06377.1 hypothetical protein A1353_09125 [Methylomonas methanica]
MSKLPVVPSTWVITELGKVVEYGKTAKVEPNQIEPTAWILELEDIEKNTSKLLAKLRFSDRDSKSTKNQFEVGDILYGKLRPYLNKVLIADDAGYCSTEIVPLKPGDYLDNRFLFYWLKHPAFLDYVEAESHGLNMPRLGTETGRAAPFVFAPLNEQKRIADKLDAVLARVDACRDRLDRIPTILKRFRQSVLAAAVSGQLTQEWRSDNQDFLQINFLYALVREERSQRNFRNPSGITEIEVAAIPFEIPENWQWVRLGNISLKITDGAHNTPKVIGSGFPYLMASDLTNGFLDFSVTRFISEKEHRELHNKCQPQVGDLLVVNIGAGTGNNVSIDVDFEFSFKNLAIIKRPSFVHPKYLKFFFDAQKQKIFNEQTRGGAQPFLSLNLLNNLLFALPPIDEQTEIVRRVESLFAYADRLEARYNAARAQVEKLTPALLAKAFRGELVPQDPNDEPASELLVCIAASKTAEQAKTRAGKRQIKPS